MYKLAIVVPCYNEEEVIGETSVRLKSVIDSMVEKGKITTSSYILFVNDGSRDLTWPIITDLHQSNKVFKGLNLAKNVGHQNALVSGLEFVVEKCDMAVSIDADLQDDVEIIEQMVDQFYLGNDIVYGVRSSRDKDSFFKKNSALVFYKIMRFLGVDTVYNHADYRLMSSRALKQLSLYHEKNLFLRGIVPLIGYKTENVYYHREDRFAGTSKYPFKKMLNFALEGITSFSVKPLRIISIIGLVSLLVSCVSFVYIIVTYFRGYNIQGWTSLMSSLWFIGSLTLISLGIIGEYIGKIYTEVKGRPRYNIESALFED